MTGPPPAQPASGEDPDRSAQHPAPAHPPAGPPHLRPVQGLGTAALALAVAVTAGEGITALAGFGHTPGAPLTPYDVLTALTSLVWLAAFVVTCLWLTRVRRNSELLAPSHHHARNPVWAWAGWFVPVVSFWFPYQVVRDALDASAAAATPHRDRVRRPPLAPWWAGWLVGQFAVSAAARRATAPLDPGEASATGLLHLLGFAGLVVSLVAWFRVVRAAGALQAAAGQPPRAP
ncbi:DUF4328 domain-containing protein [Paenibacillus sp. TRM 82003]|uniref:DUF4328 domain-containing protein n=1 Tax=Kineococcus sp. TRM81007 TaxID=2925831 RepID=UPI001F597EA6|nr:DUF4328 domain-containing protein [Kineococcus sp. TRM81007]MCI2240084.1 DUF4328 domain-containing protein [Kineococcus sp. TRM81007]MCI3925610.1 DUF4328 domain-containing protein [Paenibacillus sp. TRM 82003]